jgi:hypothetical protein
MTIGPSSVKYPTPHPPEYASAEERKNSLSNLDLIAGGTSIPAAMARMRHIRLRDRAERYNEIGLAVGDGDRITGPSIVEN